MKAFVTSDLHLTFDKVLRQEDKTLSFLILNKITEQLIEIKKMDSDFWDSMTDE